MRLYLDDNWEFSTEFFDGLLAENVGRELEKVRIPHNVREIEYNYCDDADYQMVSGYRRVLHVEKAWEGKVLLLTFDGVAHYAEVYVNGELLMAHKSGYTAFTCDISSAVKYSEDNIVAVKVDSREQLDQPPFGNVIDYMTYGGIYRDVYLEVKEQDHIEDIFVKTPDCMGGEKGLDAEIRLHTGSGTDGTAIRFYLQRSNKAGSSFGANCAYAEKQLLGQTEVRDNKSEFHFAIKGAELWDIDNPVLYVLTAELLKGGEVKDTKEVRFGFRKVELTDKGFFLNGRKIKLRGLNRHQSYAYVGYAMPKSMQALDADILKNELGVNAVRTSHYPQSHYFIDRCDEIGLLVFTEFPGWQHIGGADWKNIAVENVREMIEQYRNHPSIFLWGVRINESPDDHEFYEKTNALARSLDSTRPTGGVRYITKSELLEDVYTFNDFIHDGINPPTSRKAKVSPDMSKGYLISEYNGHMYPTKAFDDEPHRTEHAMRHARVINNVKGDDEIAGSFGWCMFDYNTHKDFGSGDKICYHGVMDMFRNPKEAAAVYRIQSETEPYLEISSSMDIGEYPGGMLKNIYIYSNADMVRMSKNGRVVAHYCTSKKERERLENKKEFKSVSNFSEYTHLDHGPVYVNDFIGDQLVKNEGYSKSMSKQVKKVLMDGLENGMSHLKLSSKFTMAKLIVFHKYSIDEGMKMYNRYISGWGENANEYSFEAIKDGKVVKTVVKGATRKAHIAAEADHTELREDQTYDVALIRITARDDYGNLLPYYQDPVKLSVSGCLELIGPDMVSLKGGMTGTYVKTTGEKGEAALEITDNRGETVRIDFCVR